MKLGIEGRRALVTNGVSAIGQSIAHTLAAEGAHVVVHGADRAEVERTVAAIIGDGGCAEMAWGDLSTEAGARQVIDGVLGRGGVDILVNNACRQDVGWADWLSMPDAHWERHFLANVMSAVRMIRPIVPLMIARRWGRIINVIDTSASGGGPAAADFSASGVALANLTFGIARSLSGSGVTANLISPAPSLTQASAIDPEIAFHMGRWDAPRSAEPVGAARSNVTEFSAAAALLASRQADHTTGTNLHVGVREVRHLH